MAEAAVGRRAFGAGVGEEEPVGVEGAEVVRSGGFDVGELGLHGGDGGGGGEGFGEGAVVGRLSVGGAATEDGEGAAFGAMLFGAGGFVHQIADLLGWVGLRQGCEEEK